jgi:hypothetical protein
MRVRLKGGIWRLALASAKLAATENRHRAIIKPEISDAAV